MLRHVLGNLTGVTRLPPRAPAPAWVPSRLNARYHVAVRLAELVLAATSVEVTAGEVTANGLLIDMPSLFEDFLTAAVRDSIGHRHGGTIRRQHQLWFDQAGRHRMAVDIAWVTGGRVRAVIDAKYKTHVPIDDLYQMLAYCTVLDLARGHLIYVAGVPATHQLRNSDVEITCHAIDLDQPPDALLNQVDRLVDEIVTASNPAARVA
jgi:5-methylcytosine-specific restriction enzyme subunit McrC